jgi:phage FluMu gp28-like protein
MNDKIKLFTGRAKILPAHPDHFLLQYQQNWYNDFSRLKLAVKARQIGWTWTSAYTHVKRKAHCGAAGDVWISSRDEAQARLYIEDCKGFGGLLDCVARQVGAVVLNPKA